MTMKSLLNDAVAGKAWLQQVIDASHLIKSVEPLLLWQIGEVRFEINSDMHWDKMGERWRLCFHEMPLSDTTGDVRISMAPTLRELFKELTARVNA